MKRRLYPLIYLVALVLVMLSLVITWVIAAAARNAMWLCFMVPILVTLSIFGVRFSCLLWIICEIGRAIVYGLEGYLNRNIEISQSCFFMPCAPQSIQEEAQKAALFAGLFLC
jgi:hypothetical protein